VATRCARIAHARRPYGADLSDPGLADLIVATDKLSMEEAAQLVTAFLAVSQLR
jgi:cytidylate kinase